MWKLVTRPQINSIEPYIFCSYLFWFSILIIGHTLERHYLRDLPGDCSLWTLMFPVERIKAIGAMNSKHPKLMLSVFLGEVKEQGIPWSIMECGRMWSHHGSVQFWKTQTLEKNSIIEFFKKEEGISSAKRCVSNDKCWKNSEKIAKIVVIHTYWALPGSLYSTRSSMLVNQCSKQNKTEKGLDL